MATMTLDTIRREADGAVYPRHILPECEDALVLFAAEFYGQQDAIWIHDAGLRAVCVDVKAAKLAVMKRLYPDTWEFIVDDVYAIERAGHARQEADKFGLVSVDCPSGHFDRCADLLPVWCSLARKFVVLGAGIGTALVEPEGWALVDWRRRSDYAGGVYWAVFERDA